MDIKTIYNQLTNIDIEKQKQIWDERGKGYYGEYLVFSELYKSIEGNGKILMNLNIPVNEYKTTEVDLIMIHETGIYVFEIKHYKGTIYGNDQDEIWTQYFRTTKNSTFKNPVKQNKYHISALEKLFPNTPIFSCIVFTSPNCDVRVNNADKSIDICQLQRLSQTLSSRFSQSLKIFSMKTIDDLFVKLAPYSQMKETVIIDSQEADFLSWIQPTISKLEEKKVELEHERQNLAINVEKYKKAKAIGIVIDSIIVVVCIIVSIIVSLVIIQQNDNTLNAFKQKFLHVDEIGNQYIDELNSYVQISDVLLEALTDDAISFSAKIAMANDTYGITLTEHAKYIVMTDSGQIFEYDVFGEHLHYFKINNMIGHGIKEEGTLAKTQFYGIANTSDISYIKITGVELFKLDVNRTVIKDNLEIELFKKQ